MSQLTGIPVDSLFRAQFGEDRVLWQVFRHRRSGFFVEIGAYDGVNLSNTYFLEQMGWHGILIEPLEPLCHKAAAARRNSLVVHAAVGKRGSHEMTTMTVTQGVPCLSYIKADPQHMERAKREAVGLVEVKVPLTTVDNVLMKARRHTDQRGNAWVPNRGWQIDLVSIDVEGMELDVLDGFDLDRFKPRVLVMENDRPSGEAIEPYLNERGYRKFHRQTINDFYVRLDDTTDGLNLMVAATE